MSDQTRSNAEDGEKIVQQALQNIDRVHSVSLALKDDMTTVVEQHTVVPLCGCIHYGSLLSLIQGPAGKTPPFKHERLQLKNQTRPAKKQPNTAKQQTMLCAPPPRAATWRRA